MSVMHMVSVESFRQSNESTRLFYTVVLIPFFLGFLHHIDHVVRGNHVGWPLTPAVTPFTFSLAVYPLALFGFCLMYVTDRTIITYWLGFFGFTSVLVTYTHTFIEPPKAILLWYLRLHFRHRSSGGSSTASIDGEQIEWNINDSGQLMLEEISIE
jgi:hypothetical protein